MRSPVSDGIGAGYLILPIPMIIPDSSYLKVVQESQDFHCFL
jgi:hypothetical protein